MNLVTLEDVAKSHGDRLLLDGVDLLINEGDRIGLIGVNGSGKTTLLRLIAGLEPVDSGTVTVWGGVRINYLSQHPVLQGDQTVLDYLFAGEAPPLQRLRAYREATAKLQVDPHNARWQQRLAQVTDELDRTGGWAAEAEAKAVLSRLGIDDFEAPLATLSGGQAKRVALARVLVDRADLLILDEPTNHIDADAVDWLEAYLLEVPGALLMVTHDRYFLGRVVNQIVELDRRQLVSYPGNYERYLEQRTARRQRLAAAEAKRRNLLRRELEWLRRTPMARGTKQKARKQRIEELEEMRAASGEERVAIALASRRLGKKVLEARGLSKRYDDQQLFSDVDLTLEPGDRLGIVGPNGAGKSTLLDILAGHTEADSGRVDWGETVKLGYYDQLSRGLDLSARVIDFINDRAPLIRTKDGHRVEAPQMLEWFLFSRPQQRAYIHSLSGGERRRLYLLWVLIQQPNVLFLDEPTNDLDIQTLNVLEEFLDHFRGSLIAVSHDRYFLDRNVEYLLTFEEGTLSGRYPGPYQHFQTVRGRQTRTAESAAEPAAASQPSRPTGTQEPTTVPQKLSWKEARELEKLESNISELEARRAKLAEAVNEAGSDYELLQDLAGQLAELEAELEAQMERWLELSERQQATAS
ncbi:MAG: ABC-F family ATP-binding cassette domain-containing protein [Candidatus Promineifilaceae bacterium]|nr:ABC-F family ATP-binding cassette domain-containing protein [Candidatus Promineifilaceae bacterium]